MKTASNPGLDWRENAKIIEAIEPTSRQLDMFICEQRKVFSDNLAEAGSDNFGNFAPKKGIEAQ
jgi:hypothetical protein